MVALDTDELFAKLDKMGEDTARLKLAQGAFSPQRKRDLVSFWLSKKKNNRQKVEEVNYISSETVLIDHAKAWNEIYREYFILQRGVSEEKLN